MGGLVRQKAKFERFDRKSHNSNPRRCGPIHYNSPSRMFWRIVRGMIPHKTPRGCAALRRLECFDRIAAPHYKLKRVVVPEALHVIRNAPNRPSVSMGTLNSVLGW